MTDIEPAAQPAPSSIPYGPDEQPWGELLAAQGLVDGAGDGALSAPTRVPRTAYPPVAGLDEKDFQLPPGGLSRERRRRAMTAIELYLEEKRDHQFGYQVNQDMDDVDRDLSRFMRAHLNNIGDPFMVGNYKPNTKIAERAVLDYYAALWHAKWPHTTDLKDPDWRESYWGYMLSMGATEGNLYALWNARDYLGGKALLHPGDGSAQLRYVQAPLPEGEENAYHPVAFYSEDTHYSFAKAVRVMNIDTFHAIGERLYKTECPLEEWKGRGWPTEVPSEKGPSGTSADGPGSIDVEALRKLVAFFAGKGHPILVSLNYGSTFKGAHDDVRRVCDALLPVFEDNRLLKREMLFGEDEQGRPVKDVRRGFWIHVDGALGAGYAPFMRMASRRPEKFGWRPDVELPEFDFGLRSATTTSGPVDMVCSIAMSGHKWPGGPWPYGIYMTKVKYQLQPPMTVQYIGSLDTTFAGSRNGFSPLVAWNHLARLSYQGQVAAIRRAQDRAALLERRLRELESRIGRRLWVHRTPGSLSVLFRCPNDAIIDRWSLATQSVPMRPREADPARREMRRYAHVFVMASVTEEMIDKLIRDLSREDAFPEEPMAAVPARFAEQPMVTLAEGVRSLAGVPWHGRGFG